MKEEDINITRFSKTELLDTLETLLLGYYTSDFDEGQEPGDKNELVLNYLTIKKLIKESEAV
ncbi:MAG: hypothetical protein HEP71_00685 [Roseivirga sp.]|nr:hypothetical protein [Roseivirga sp.]